MPQTIIESTAQQFLEIHDITNDIVLMKTGTASVIIAVDAMNFGLLAEEEQDAVMYAYAGLLNSLNYPIQIVIRSQTKDVTGYLHLLKDQEDKANSRSNQQRIARYREFVTNLIHDRNVLDKKFYVVIPATNLELGLFSAQGLVPGGKGFDINSVEKTVIIEKAKNLLDPKRDHIISQFARIGLYSRQLTTQEMIQLFYVSYNPEASEGQIIDESRSYTTPLVKASIESPSMINATQSPPSTNDSDQSAPAQAPGMAPAATPAMDPVMTPPPADATMGQVPMAPAPMDAAPTSATPMEPTPMTPAPDMSSPPAAMPPMGGPVSETPMAPTPGSTPAPTPPSSGTSVSMNDGGADLPKPSMPSMTPPAQTEQQIQDEINKSLGTMPAGSTTMPGAEPNPVGAPAMGGEAPAAATPTPTTNESGSNSESPASSDDKSGPSDLPEI